MSAARSVPVARAVRDLAPPPGARAFHLATAVVVTAGLVLDATLALTASGEVPGVRLLRWTSHFTVQGSLLAAVTCWALAARPTRGVSVLFRVARLGAVLAAAATLPVYLVVLGPVLDPQGAAGLADAVLHYLGPALVLAGWVVYGPRRRVDRRTALLTLGWPVAFVGWTLGHAAASGFTPYPFLDADARGYPAVLGRAALALLLLAAVAAGARWADRRLEVLSRVLVPRARRPA